MVQVNRPYEEHKQHAQEIVRTAVVRDTHQFPARTRIPAEYIGEESRACVLQAAAAFADAGAAPPGLGVDVEDPAFRCLKYTLAGEKDCGPRTKNPAAGLATAASRAVRALTGAPQERIIC